MIQPELMNPGKTYADVHLPDGRYFSGVVKFYEEGCYGVVNILFEDGILLTTHMSNVVIYSKKEELDER